jgi:hypothetical protein
MARQRPTASKPPTSGRRAGRLGPAPGVGPRGHRPPPLGPLHRNDRQATEGCLDAPARARRDWFLLDDLPGFLSDAPGFLG